MNKRERGEIYGMIAVVALIVTMVFFQPEFKGFLGWEKFLVGIQSMYSICFAILLCKLITYKIENIKRSIFYSIIFSDGFYR